MAVNPKYSSLMLKSSDKSLPEIRTILTGKDRRPLFNELIEFQPYKKWKFLRDLTTPVFTSSARLKNSNEAMRASIADFVKEIKEKVKSNGNGCKFEKFNVHGEIHGLLTILIARSQYSIDIGQSGETNPFIKNVQEVMGSASMNSPFKTSLGTAFPFLQKLIPTSIINPEPMREFRVIMKQMLDMRRTGNKSKPRSKSGDFLDSVLEWYDNLESETYKEIGINELTIIVHGLLLFLAGQDPMSLVLASLLYHIAKDRDIETTVQQEVDRVFKNAPGGILSHESLSELTYLSGCIHEAARLYPFFYRSERLCTKDWSYPDKGLHLKKGQVVMIPLAAVNRNPEYFEDPEEFKPERFLPGKKELLHPAAFMSFGFGPRVCPGKRLAMEIMTLVAAYLIREFKFILRKDSAIEFVPSGPFYAANEPVYLDVEARTKSYSN